MKLVLGPLKVYTPIEGLRYSIKIDHAGYLLMVKKFITGGGRVKMERPVTLFTGQWADLPLGKLAKKASSWGYDGES